MSTTITKSTGFQLSTEAKVFCIVMGVEFVVNLALTLERIITSSSPDDTYYAVLFTIVSIFIAYFAIHSVVTENHIELFAFMLATVLLTFYVFYQFFIGKAGTEQEKLIVLIRFIAMCVFFPANILGGYLVYRQFGWRMYKIIGASVELTRLYRNYQVFVSLVKTDLEIFFVGTLLVQFFVLDTSNTKKLIIEIIVNTCVVILSLVWVAIGWVGVRKESNTLMKIFLFLSIVEPAFVIYTLVINNRVYEFVKIYVVMTLGGLALFCRALLIVWTFVVCNGFTKGLRAEVFSSNDDEEQPLIKTAINVAIKE